jgi:photosystem II stability/assembly factor-like uncharacterized protein
MPTARSLLLFSIAASLSLGLLLPPTAQAQLDARVTAGLRWRCIGPFRGGRTVAAVGIPGQRHEFLIGVNHGGVWKTTDAGRTWDPIFDDQPTGSIGAIAVAPSDPRVIYVGSGEGLQRPDLSVGDGVYRSRDGGRTWRHVGLEDGQQIPALAVDPRDPQRVYAAVLGHPYGANDERGVYRSSDGGEHWERVLWRNHDTGAMDVLLAPDDPRTLYAVLWSARQPPWEVGGSFVRSEDDGLWKSSDGGSTWRALGAGLPTAADGLGRIGIATCASRPARLYAVLGARKGGGLYRSDDAGEHWTLVNDDRRLWERDGDFNEVKADPHDPDVVYVANVVTWKSTDGGRTFAAFRGAPGGDDYHRLWISPEDGNTILLAGDQGAVVTLNGGRTWSSWYNQPTAQFYHVSTDRGFPYKVYGAQQESGSVGISSRGDDGGITLREWHPVGVEEYGYVAADPLHEGVVFGGKLERYDARTGDVQVVSPDPLRAGEYRWVRTMPVVFSPLDPHVLYLGANVVFETRDGGQHWRTLGGDLTRAAGAAPANLGAFTPLDPERGTHRGVVYSIAPSPLRLPLLWAGTDDGLVHVTHDGGRTWRDVTPPALTPWSKVSLLEASHFDTLVAYAAVNRFRLDDVAPHIWRTRDGGRTWAEIVTGIGAKEVVNAVREDPVVPGLLYAATEHSVSVSFDDGDHWQSLRLNLPSTSVRDLVVHDRDLVIGTHGRSFWILDDVTPLRQARTALASPRGYLCAPAPAFRVRANRNTDTPMPPDEPMGENPPDGAVLDWRLADAPRGEVTLEILDGSGARVRRFSSSDPPDTLPTGLQVPPYWMRRGTPLPAHAGMNRFVWDLHGAPLPGVARDYPISATPGDTPAEPRGPWALPGDYRVRLSAGGERFERTLTLRMDPRVGTPAAGLRRQHELSAALVAAMRGDSSLSERVRAARGAAAHAPAADSSLASLLGSDRPGFTGAAPARPPDLARVMSQLVRLYQLVQGTDAPPTPAMEAAARTVFADLEALRARGERLLAGSPAGR